MWRKDVRLSVIHVLSHYLQLNGVFSDVNDPFELIFELCNIWNNSDDFHSINFAYVYVSKNIHMQCFKN